MPTLVSSPGLTIEAATLRLLVDALRSEVDDLADGLAREIDVDPSSVETSFVIELPTPLAGPAGKALRSLDLAWRLALTVSEVDPDNLRAYGSVELDELVPVEDEGLVVTSVELGSLVARVKAQKKVTLRRAITTVNLVATAASISGVSAKDLVNATAAQAARPPAQVKVVANLGEGMAERARIELQGLPPGSKFTEVITAPSGGKITVTITVPER